MNETCNIKMCVITQTSNWKDNGLLQESTDTISGNYVSMWSENISINPLKPKLNPICYLLALLGTHHFLHVSRIRVKLLTFRLLMS